MRPYLPNFQRRFSKKKKLARQACFEKKKICQFHQLHKKFRAKTLRRKVFFNALRLGGFARRKNPRIAQISRMISFFKEKHPYVSVFIRGYLFSLTETQRH